MKTIKILRITFFVVLFQYSVHLLLFLKAKPTHGPDETNIVDTMKSHIWDFGGFNRSYWDFYFGYGLIAVLLGVIEILILWQLSKPAKTTSPIIKPFILILLFSTLAHAVLILNYFFLLPALFDFAAAILLALAYLKSKNIQSIYK